MSRYNPQVSVFFIAQPTAVTGPRGIAKKSCTTPLFFSSLSLYIYMYMYLYMYACMCNLFSLVIPMHQKFGMLPDSEGFSMGPIVGQYQTSMVSLDAPRRGLASKTGHGFPWGTRTFLGVWRFREICRLFLDVSWFHQIGVLEIYGFLWSPHLKPGRSPRPARPATLRSRTLMHGRWRAARRQPREPGRVRWIWEIYEETNGFSRGNHGKPWETGGFPKRIKESDEV